VGRRQGGGVGADAEQRALREIEGAQLPEHDL
jgi:hypothetical protein